MEFKCKPTLWENVGIEPPAWLQQGGFEPKYKPPAEYFNWIFNKYTACILELQQTVEDFGDGKADADHRHDNATTEEDGFMSKEDKEKLDKLVEEGGGVKDYNDLANRPNLYKKAGGFFTSYVSSKKIPGDISLASIVLVKNRDAITDNEYSGIPDEQKYPMLDTPSLSISTTGDHMLGECSIGSGNNLKGGAKYSILCGLRNYVGSAGSGSHICGGADNSISMGQSCNIVSGAGNQLRGSQSIVEGYYNTVEESAFTRNCILAGDGNQITEAPLGLLNSVITGNHNQSNGNGDGNIIIGAKNTSKDLFYSIIGGANNTAEGKDILQAGRWLISKNGNTVLGRYNKTPKELPINGDVATGDAFIIGNGIGKKDGTPVTRSNAMRVTMEGDVYGTKAFNATGADYAEMFEWQDGNPNNEDRRGLFVTLDGEEIRLANAEDDFIFGVVSACPSVVGDNYADDWKGKYKRDVFGEKIRDENGSWVLNPDYDPEQDTSYIPRDQRKEWAAVGMMGKLVVCDDGTCQVNGYCFPGKNGIATKSDTGFRVMKRLDKNHIRILV